MPGVCGRELGGEKGQAGRYGRQEKGMARRDEVWREASSQHWAWAGEVTRPAMAEG